MVYMQKPESVLENEMNKILWDFNVQMDHPIQAIQPDLVLINKKKRTYQVDFAVLAEQSEKQKKKKLNKYLDLARDLKMLLNMKVTVMPVIVGTLGTVLKKLEKRLGEMEIRGRLKTI